MPITDKLTHVGAPGTITSLQAPGKAIGATSINIGSATNWPTDTAVYFAMRVVNSGSVTSTNPSGIVTGTYTEWKGTVSGTVISNLTLVSGTDQVYAAGSNTQVYIGISAAQMNSLIDALLLFANQDGSLKSAPVKAALGITSGSGGGWDILNAGTAPTVASGYNHGNKEYALTFNGVDLTSTLSAGMRLKFDRGTTAPTQSMSFTAASSQYATKASPTGITFTSAFTCEAWIYTTAYPTGGQGGSIIGRTDTSTGGFQLRLNGSGQVSIYYAGSSTFTEWFTLQSVPLNRWVHVSASVSSVSAKTLTGIYINGIPVPIQNGSQNATTIVQTSNLSVGGAGAGVTGSFFNGYISEARVWGVAQTQTQIQDNMAISLTGSETNLVALFQGNSNFTDKTANANTLTATGGAIATQAANPYNTTEYAIVTKVAYATSTTTVTVFTGTDYNIPLGTLINPFSSFQKAPFGFPAARTKWRIETFILNNNSTGTALSTVTDTNTKLSIPTGEWRYGFQGVLEASSTTAANIDMVFFLDTVSTNYGKIPTVPDPGVWLFSPNAATFATAPAYRESSVSLTAQTIYTLYTRWSTGAGTISSIIRGDQGGFNMYAECAYC